MSLSHLILGLLYRKPDSGYDLNKRFEQSVAHFWTTDQSQIYRTLYKLRDKGWVKDETVVQEGNPNKKVYSITEEGKESLVNWLQQPIEDELIIRDGATGQIFFGDVLEPEQIIHVQQQYIEKIQSKVDTYRAVEHAIFADVNFDEYPLGMELAHATLQYGILILETEIDWRKKLIERIKLRQGKHN